MRKVCIILLNKKLILKRLIFYMFEILFIKLLNGSLIKLIIYKKYKLKILKYIFKLNYLITFEILFFLKFLK